MFARFLLAGCLLGAAPFEGERVHCQAEQAIACSGAECADRPDENPHAEFTLERRDRAGELCTVTNCRSVRWSTGSGAVRISDGAEDYSLQLHSAREFRLVRSDGTGWRGRCSSWPG